MSPASSASVELIPMFCIRCQTPVPARPDEVAWVCTNCSQGMLLSDEKGLLAFEFHFSSAIPAGAKGKPYWIATATVSMQRQTFRGNQTNEMLAFWQQSRSFFVPAYEIPLQQLVTLGVQYLRQPPVLQPGNPAPFEPVTALPTDIRSLAEFIILEVEAERKDDLKRLDFSLALEQPELWILP